MFALSGLRAATAELEAGPTLDEFLANARHHFGRKQHRPDGRQGPALKITRAERVLLSVTEEIVNWRSELGDDLRALALAKTIAEPVVVFEGATPRQGHARFLLVASFSSKQGRLACVVTCEQSQEQHRDGQPLVFDQPHLFDLDDEVEPVTAMIGVFKATRDPAGLVDKKRPQMLLLGGEPRTVQQEIQAVAAVFGYRAEVFGRPESNLERARQAIAQRKDLIAIWSGAMPHRSDVVQRLADTAKLRGLTVVQLSSQDLAGMIDDLTLELAAQKPSVVPPTSMLEALEQAKAACPHLVFLPEADESAASSPFWRPKDALDATQALDEVARRWQEGGLARGVHEAMKNAPVNYAADISDTTKGKYGAHYLVNYGQRRVMLGPHIRLGKKTPERCARVYWFIDNDRSTFVIGHFGRHLPDDTS